MLIVWRMLNAYYEHVHVREIQVEYGNLNAVLPPLSHPLPQGTNSTKNWKKKENRNRNRQDLGA